MARVPGKHSSKWGGARPNSGPKYGRPEKLTKALLQEAFENGQHPFQYLLEVSRDTGNDQKTRMAAASWLLPYCVPKQATIDMNVTSEVSNLSLEEKIALANSVRGRILEHDPQALIPELPANNGVEVEQPTESE